jgi:anti-sigma B factor antagonist
VYSVISLGEIIMNTNAIQLEALQLDPQRVIVSFKQDSLDAGNIKEFREQINPWLTNSQIVYLDMSKLNFVDSSGLGALLSCLRSMNNKNGQLRLFGVSKPVLALFELVRMHHIFSIYASLSEAQGEQQAA